MDVAALVSANIVSSVSLIALNKRLVASGFRFILFLSALHFGTGYVFLLAASQSEGPRLFRRPPPGVVPRVAILALAAAGAASICVTNASLRYNSMGTYQIIKVSVLPATMVITLLEGVGRPTLREALAAALVVLGTLLCIGADVRATAFGLALGAAGVVSTALYQVWQGRVQKEHSLGGAQALLLLSLPQALMTLAASSVMEVDVLARLAGKDVNGDLAAHAFSMGELALLAATCAAAVVLNYSTIAVIGRTSAVTMQFAAQAKTALILLLDAVLNPRAVALPPEKAIARAIGLVCIFGGVAWYSRERQLIASAAAGATARSTTSAGLKSPV